MAGKHEPPTKRSYYVSLATSTLKVGIIAAVVVLGVLVLRNAFPEDTGVGVVSPTTSPTATSPTDGPSPSPTPTVSPEVEGVVVQVLNGTTTTGLAAQVSQILRDAGYTLKTPGNAPNTETTTIYHQAGSEVDAEHMRERFFAGATLEPAPPSVPADVEIQVVVGTDFTPASPSP